MPFSKSRCHWGFNKTIQRALSAAYDNKTQEKVTKILNWIYENLCIFTIVGGKIKLLKRYQSMWCTIIMIKAWCKRWQLQLRNQGRDT